MYMHIHTYTWHGHCTCRQTLLSQGKQVLKRSFEDTSYSIMAPSWGVFGLVPSSDFFWGHLGSKFLQVVAPGSVAIFAQGLGSLIVRSQEAWCNLSFRLGYPWVHLGSNVYWLCSVGRLDNDSKKVLHLLCSSRFTMNLLGMNGEWLVMVDWRWGLDAYGWWSANCEIHCNANWQQRFVKMFQLRSWAMGETQIPSYMMWRSCLLFPGTLLLPILRCWFCASKYMELWRWLRLRGS